MGRLFFSGERRVCRRLDSRFHPPGTVSGRFFEGCFLKAEKVRRFSRFVMPFFDDCGKIEIWNGLIRTLISPTLPNAVFP